MEGGGSGWGTGRRSTSQSGRGKMRRKKRTVAWLSVGLVLQHICEISEAWSDLTLESLKEYQFEAVGSWRPRSQAMEV